MRRLVVQLLIATALSVSLPQAFGRPPARKKEPNNQEADQLVQQGDVFRSHGQLSHALWAYRQAAKTGNVNGAFAAGDMLLEQGQASSGRERILQLFEGLEDLFFAATNGHALACADLSIALENGIGVETNLISAYAWLELATERDPSFKADLDRLVMQLDPDDIQQAQVLASEYAHGQWPTDLVHPVDQGDSRFSIQGITSNGRESLAIINNVSFAAGDSAVVQPANNTHDAAKDEITISCREIGDNYVLVSVAGESRWKLLSSEPLR